MYRQGGSKLQANDIVAVKYVTVIGHVGDFAVYMGESSQSDQDIAQRGDKVDEATARAVAPYCAHLTYRP
jgi:hypothetical protein